MLTNNYSTNISSPHIFLNGATFSRGGQLPAPAPANDAPGFVYVLNVEWVAEVVARVTSTRMVGGSRPRPDARS